MKKWKYQKRSKPCPHCTLWGENGPLAFEVRKIILEPEIIIILNNIIRLLNESVHFFILMKFLVARVLRENSFGLPASPRSNIEIYVTRSLDDLFLDDLFCSLITDFTRFWLFSFKTTNRSRFTFCLLHRFSVMYVKFLEI